jgi:ribonuclease HII
MPVDAERKRERALWSDGLRAVAGVDEAGVGPLAGPVVAAAVVLPEHFCIEGIDDSKKLTEARRERQFERIVREARAWCIAEASPEEIDTINIYHAGLLAMRRAVAGLAVSAEHALVDGRTIGGLRCSETRIVGGDAQEACIAAASILAKVHRDRVMVALDAEYPGYGLAGHKGYPTKAHFAALAKLGPSPAHRLSYAALQPYRGALGPLFAGRAATEHAEQWRRELRAQAR